MMWYSLKEANYGLFDMCVTAIIWLKISLKVGFKHSILFNSLFLGLKRWMNTV